MNSDGDPEANYFFLQVLLQSMPNLATNMVMIIIVLVLLIFTAIVAGSEVAFFSLSAKDVNYLKSKNEGSNRTIIQLLEKPKKLLATLLIANSFLSIGIIITTGLILEPLLDVLKNSMPSYGTLIYRFIQIVLVTFLLVLFGEVLPKVYATQNNLRMSLFCAPIINALNKFFAPFSNFLVRSSALIEKNINTKPSEISDEDMENAIQLTVGHSASEEEMNLIKGTLNFRDIAVKQIMRPRMDVNGIEFNSTFTQMQAAVLECGYSRIPVYEGTLDTVKGVIHTKDLLAYINSTNEDWHKLVRSAFFVHESKLIEDLLFEFKKRRIHLAVVVDEFGGTSGIVTLEDIMEEIIGDIRDEFDEDESDIKKINDHTYICDGKTLINDMCKVIDEQVEFFDEARGESDTLGGLWMELSGKFPVIGETATYKQYSFMVQELEKNRVKKIKVMIEPSA
jgi:gliding motility-associated protein GldE